VFDLLIEAFIIVLINELIIKEIDIEFNHLIDFLYFCVSLIEI